MVDSLKMPGALSSIRIECQQRICKEIVPSAIEAIKVVNRGSCGDVNDAALLIECHTGPVVTGSRHLPRVPGPCFITVLPWQRNRVKRPPKRASMHVESANVAMKSRLRLRGPEANDDHVLVDHARTCQCGELLRIVARRETFTEVEFSSIGKGSDEPGC